MIDFIEVPENNIFQNGRLETMADGTQMLFRDRLKVEPREGDAYHTVRDNEPLDLIAYIRYKDKVDDASKWWWLIADANGIENPLDISDLVGKDILIPDVLRIKAGL